LPAVNQQIVDLTLNGRGVRDIVRVLGISSATVIDVLKKKRARDPTGHRTSAEEP
jgi:transposase-like protein